MQKVFLATDHAGFALKEVLYTYISTLGGYQVEDMGAFTFDQEDDYPDFIRPCAERVAHEPGSIGIILGGSGQGEAMVANRIPGVRAVVFYGGTPDDIVIASLAREHNNANVLSLGARFLTEDEAKQAVKIFLETSFNDDERHVRRIAKF